MTETDHVRTILKDFHDHAPRKAVVRSSSTIKATDAKLTSDDCCGLPLSDTFIQLLLDPSFSPTSERVILLKRLAACETDAVRTKVKILCFLLNRWGCSSSTHSSLSPSSVLSQLSCSITLC